MTKRQSNQISKENRLRELDQIESEIWQRYHDKEITDEILDFELQGIELSRNLIDQ